MTERTRTDYLVVHCSATEAGNDIGAAHIDRWHKGRGWSRIGYHGVIRLDGSFELGRDWQTVGAHCRGHNKVSVGICLIGGLRDGQPCPTYNRNQLDTLRSTLVFMQYIWPEAEIVGHRDLSPDANSDGVIDRLDWLKACPCFDVRHWWKHNEVVFEVSR